MRMKAHWLFRLHRVAPRQDYVLRHCCYDGSCMGYAGILSLGTVFFALGG
jgi:hypothetical protein